MKSRLKERVAVVATLFLCFFDPRVLLAQESASTTKGLGTEASSFDPAQPNIPPVANARKSSENWLPEDIDATVPAVSNAVGCPLPTVLHGAAQRVVELVKNVDRFTATEVLEHQDVNSSGLVGRPVTVKFDYLVSVAEGRDGSLNVEELRNRGKSLASFPNGIATIGTPSMVLIFHPQYIGDFRTQCEGLGEWHGQLAWQVRFEQRSDRPSRMCSFVVNRKNYEVKLRGRAWILADSLQVARIETDLIQPIPAIRLFVNHEIIEYRPVKFAAGNLNLWLPFSAELYVDLLGHRFYRKHAFSDFKIFSVDMQYRTRDPKETTLTQ